MEGSYSTYMINETGTLEWLGTASRPSDSTAPYGLENLTHEKIRTDLSGIEYKDYIVHAHTSNPEPDPSLDKKRIYPHKDDAFSQASFIEPLKAAGVEHCSIEADVLDFATDAKLAYEILNELR